MATSCVTVVTDAPGRLLLGISGAGLILFAALRGAHGQSWQSPRAACWSAGGPARQLRRPDIKIIRISEFRRIGRKMRLLEIDANDGRLYVFSRWDRQDPLDVLDALTANGYAGS